VLRIRSISLARAGDILKLARNRSRNTLPSRIRSLSRDIIIDPFYTVYKRANGVIVAAREWDGTWSTVCQSILYMYISVVASQWQSLQKLRVRAWTLPSNIFVVSHLGRQTLVSDILLLLHLECCGSGRFFVGILIGLSNYCYTFDPDLLIELFC
jgi:hypothetical protein